EFVEYLREEKPGRKVRDDTTIRYYRSLFTKYLEGKELGPELIEEVRSVPVAWARNVFRHYVGFLYDRGEVADDVYARVMRRVPSRRYAMDVRPYQIREEDAKGTMEFLREHRPRYYLAYRLMIEGGLRPGTRRGSSQASRPRGRLRSPGSRSPSPGSSRAGGSRATTADSAWAASDSSLAILCS
ncbi:MAG: hypothetical protein ACP5G6_09220, partial [Conexivisphaera sp.]